MKTLIASGIMRSSRTGPILQESAAGMPAPNKKRSSSLGCFLIVVGGVAFLVGLVFFLSWSSITGQEFSPVSFQSRSFEYSRVPGTKLRLTATKLGTPTAIPPTDVLKHLPTLQRPAIWHVSEITGLRFETHAAKILVQALQQQNADGANYWGAWSAEHPKQAAVLWPLVQQVALEELYACVPELLSQAEQADDASMLEQLAFEVIADAVQERCRFLRSEGDDASVEKLLDWFLSLKTTTTDQGVQDSIRQRKERVRRESGKP